MVKPLLFQVQVLQEQVVVEVVGLQEEADHGHQVVAQAEVAQVIDMLMVLLQYAHIHKQ